MDMLQFVLMFGVAQVLCNPWLALTVIICDGSDKEAILVTVSSIMLAIICYLTLSYIRGTL